MRRLATERTVPPRLRGRLLPAALIALAGTGPAVAQDSGTHLLDSALEMMNLKADPGTMPDFVRQSRPDLSQDNYITAGSRPAARDVKAKTPAEIKALTAELDAAHAAQLAGKRPKPPSAEAGGPAKAAGSAKAGKPGAPLDLRGTALQATNR